MSPSSSGSTLYLIDISSFIFRAFFAIRSLRNKAGEPTNAVYGVATMLARLAEEVKPEYLAVVYDSKEPSFRKQIFSDYKANRSAPPDDLVPQFSRIEALIRAFEIHSYRQKGVEADDLIATLTKRWCEASPENRVMIVSGDKDLMQLVNDRVQTWDTMSNKVYGATEVEAKFGIKPDQLRDYLALVGDSSDNIPGVTGIGPKGAVDLLKQFGTLDQILDAAKQEKIAGKKGNSLRQNEQTARLSAELATVREDLNLEIPLDELKYHFHVTSDCVQLLKELEFHTLVSKWQNFQSQSLKDQTSARTEADSRFRTVHTESEFEDLLRALRSVEEFGFDLETTSLNPHAAEIVGVAICYDLEFAFYIPVGHQDTSLQQLPKQRVFEGLKPFIENQNFKKVGQNLKYDWSVLRALGWNPDGIGADTMIAAYLLDPSGRHNLKTLASQYLDYTVLTYEEVSGKGKDQVTFDQVSIALATRYSAEDAWVALHLWKKLKPLLEKESLLSVFYQVDLPLVSVLSRMELEGVCIDTEWLHQLSFEFQKELDQLDQRVQVYSKEPLNLNSPKQIAQLLFTELKLPTQEKTKTGYSTDAYVLETLAPLHEVPRLLLEYREISKLKGTYVDPLPQLRDSKTGKIHAAFHQTVAVTGRLSSSDPNLQNIPIRTERGLKIRRAFVPSSGNVFVAADYNQIELRLLAHMSGDPELTRSFVQNEDVHKRTASEIFQIPTADVTDHQRSIAKAINFGLMYGKTAFGLSQELRISRREASDMIAKYFERYNAVKTYLEGQIAQARDKGYVETLLGRKRWLPDIHSRNPAIRNNAERMAMNTPIQGTAADLMKLAMIEIDQRLGKEQSHSRLIIQVHDEVVLDCPEGEAKAVEKLVIDAMENVWRLSVPLRVTSGIGKNWLEI